MVIKSLIHDNSKMKAQGIPIQTIQDLTGLNIEEVELI